MRQAVMRLLRAVDGLLARPGARWERPALSSFLFHSVFGDEREVDSGALLPQERLTEASFGRFVEYLLEAGYEFVSAAQIAAGLPPGSRYAHMTLDDGYANNLRLLEPMRRYGVPVTLSISTSHVVQQKAFWWDVVYRGRHRQGRADEVGPEIAALHRAPLAEIERHVMAEFGRDALRPLGDLDRPLTPAELDALAREPLVTIGNHTVDHRPLGGFSKAEVAEQLSTAQRDLQSLIGRAPEVISYPHGDYDDSTLEVARRHGLTIGITTEPRKDPLRPSAGQLMRLGRFSVICDDRLADRLRRRRSNLSIEGGLRRLLRHPEIVVAPRDTNEADDP
jgi:peptidoglycan/xylan/chitin deacetylase (PgdA/CDA1 family)